MPETLERPERGRGRPRDMEKDSAIRAATWSVLARRGYGDLTFEAVAEVAGCGRSTLYRRFGSKLELIAAVLGDTSRSIGIEIPVGLPPRETLLAYIAGTQTYMSGERGPALLSVGAAAARETELAAAIELVKRHERAAWYDMFLRLVPGASEPRMSFVFETFIGIMLHHVAGCHTHFDDAQIAVVADLVIHLLQRPGSGDFAENPSPR